MVGWFFELIQMPFVQRGLIEVLAFSIGAGLLGTWIVLRGLAFYSHAVGMATFPGLVLAGGFGFAAPLGAFGAAVLFAGALEGVSRKRQGGYDSFTALVVVGMLAAGIMLASDVFHSGSSVDALLFGSLLAVSPGNVALTAAASGLTLTSTCFLGRIWLATGFDGAGVRSLGVRPAAPDALLLLLVALVATTALSTVGALLATTLLVVPAATARPWIRRLLPWQIISVILAAVEGVGGLWISLLTNAPPGASIAVIAGVVFALSVVTSRLSRSSVLRGRGALADTLTGLVVRPDANERE